ncbi:MAG: flagellar protein FlaG [Defluviitoga tunisiensis]|uniref:Flagellar protein FlaG n=1 Tax=Defluviitoga tunisiensis TaxID=1006576 RepID=A0A0C7NLR8_DEFTU|nr:flagellar protein FlaG [Defluviitoga tunisiensis]MDY0380340.1 flagellar protein FlaG [Defluviitoga tunisiensis]CEP78826.1 flagellar protein FlaG [Defluviitoga tunisiensis]HOK16329.1 flagellar protein FlaG [Defluviitoga tunisiensis]HOL87147.1 flagellar protein FlaG [Defluviitoga tunisiensis]HPU59649.1 flagellar protein FlaG [Defluviitoga tunisiensis]
MEIPNVGGSFNLKNENIDFIINKNRDLLLGYPKDPMVENLDEQTREATVSSEELDQISKIIEQRLEKLSQIFKGEAHFEIDRDLDILIIKIIERETERIIRQIPPEVSLKLARALNELEGILFDERA